MSDLDRIDSLERLLRALYPEVQALRDEVRRLSAQVAGTPVPPAAPSPALAPEPLRAPVSPPPPPRPRRPPARPVQDGLDVEKLVGRYGTLALATLTILLGVGAFISWALTHHLLGPEMRVGLGALLAAGLAAAGWQLRRSSSPQFGKILLGLALAVVHVDAWGAGPQLHLVSTPVALAVAALASAALSVFARIEGEEALFAVGVGGALLAPFVTSDGQHHLIPFLIFGYVVIALAMAALGDEEWNVAAWLVAAGNAVYVFTGLSVTGHVDPATQVLAPAAFTLAIAATATIVAPLRYRARLALSALAVLVLAIGVRSDIEFATADLVMAALGTIVSYAAIWTLDLDDDLDGPSVAGAVVLPLALMAVAMIATHSKSVAALLGLAWAAGAAVAALTDTRGGSARRGCHMAVAAMACGTSAVVWLMPDHQVVCVIAMAAYATVLALLVRREEAQFALILPSGLALLGATYWGFLLLATRVHYQYRPFATPASLGALAVSAAWFVCAWHAARLWPDRPNALRLVALAVAFLWGRMELAGAISAEASTFLLIAYYAVVGVIAIFLGRARGIPALRHVGLGLAVYAALKAVVQASELAIGLRIGSYFLAGAFMMAVAYWYRARQDPPAVTAPPA